MADNQEKQKRTHRGQSLRLRAAHAREKMDRLASQDPKRTVGVPVNRERNAHRLDGVRFGSNAAAELAIRNGLSAADFVNWAPSGLHGYTSADVEDLVRRIRRDKMGASYEVKG